MYYPAELIFKSYLPKSLELGMLFVNKISVGLLEPEIELWSLDNIPDDIDEFLTKNGAPVELLIVCDVEGVLAEQSQIGWFDEGEESDELYDISLEEINIIINDYEGNLMIEIEEYFYDKDIIVPVLIDNKVIISYIEYDDEED
jgi:hypothetical protein